MSFSPDKTKGRYSIKTDGKKERNKERERERGLVKDTPLPWDLREGILEHI